MSRKPARVKSKPNIVEERSEEMAMSLFEMFGSGEKARETIEMFRELTNLSEQEEAWLVKNMNAMLKNEKVKSDPYYKHRVKMRMIANAWDWARFFYVADQFSKDLEEIIPMEILWGLLRLHIANSEDPIQSAYVFGSAIESGLKDSLQAKGVSEIFEITVPIQARFVPKVADEAGSQILGKAFEKFQEKVKEKALKEAYTRPSEKP